ncbi:alpha/beta hydrolase [Methylocella sp. CPCC 101449]|uniref:alpha/beta hydrolase n=1 Tax=Methylocella sp. CPCC 101449 TaxID=2987531 RepID=UPI00288F1A45|nr:alpha/beta hydrolase [Methylocella sp. CPCC 101449]MDT2022267.1 alpha/beta hydrolase [Methylocella sp. CPCC 101449]
MFRSWRILPLAVAIVASAYTVAARAQSTITTRNDITFAEHDQVKLVGDLYMPQGVQKAPILIAVHGGGWQVGDRKIYQNLGPYLAKNGYAVFAIEYRLNKPQARSYPGAIYDTKAAIQYVRANAASLGIDPDRIGLIGDSAGGHLSALVALAGEEPLYSTDYRSDPNASVSAKVKAVVGFYGVYDMQAQWQHDLVTRPRDNIAEKFLGAAPYANRKVYFDSSPINYAMVDKNGVRFLLIHGTDDDIVDPATQSTAFLLALKQAGFYVRTVVVPGAGHFFVTDPVDDTSFGGFAGPKIVRFLAEINF